MLGYDPERAGAGDDRGACEVGPKWRGDLQEGMRLPTDDVEGAVCVCRSLRRFRSLDTLGSTCLIPLDQVN